jgi:hypothetical protein
MIEEIGVICAIEHHNSQQVVLVETQIKSAQEPSQKFLQESEKYCAFD